MEVGGDQLKLALPTPGVAVTAPGAVGTVTLASTVMFAVAVFPPSAVVTFRPNVPAVWGAVKVTGLLLGLLSVP